MRGIDFWVCTVKFPSGGETTSVIILWNWYESSDERFRWVETLLIEYDFWDWMTMRSLWVWLFECLPCSEQWRNLLDIYGGAKIYLKFIYSIYIFNYGSVRLFNLIIIESILKFLVIFCF